MSQNLFKAFLLLLFFSCASQLPPSGGIEDISGPLYISSSLADGPKGLYIEIVFDEKINPQSIVNAFSIQPDVKITAKAKGNRISLYSDDGFLSSTVYRVAVSRSIRDAHDNAMDAPVSFALSKSDEVPESSIAGSISNSSSDIIYIISLHECISHNMVIYTTESSSDNSFLFSNIEPGSYFISATLGSDMMISNRISSSEYAFGSGCLAVGSNEQLAGYGLMISEPLSRKKIASARFINQAAIEIVADTGERYYQIYSEGIDRDSTIVEYQFSSHAERYSTAFGPISLSSPPDLTVPRIESCKATGDSLLIRFSEPVQLMNEQFPELYELRPGLYKTRAEVSIAFEAGYIRDFAGNFMSDTTITINSPETDSISYGSLSGRVVGDSTVNYVVQAQSDMIATPIRARADAKGSYTLPGMHEGYYSIYVYEDNNPIGRDEYFSGSMAPFRFGAPFIFMGDSIEVRGGWEIGLEDVKFRIR